MINPVKQEIRDSRKTDWAGQQSKHKEHDPILPMADKASLE